MKSCNFVFDYGEGLYYKCHEISINRGGSFLDSRSKAKRLQLNPQNNDNNYFLYVATVPLNHGSIGKNPQRITRIRPFINQYG